MTTPALTEAEKLARVPGIFYVDEPAGRRARISGTGLDVFELIEVWLGVDRDRARLADYFSWMTPEQLQAGLDFYAAFPEEIDQRLAREWEIARRLEAAEKITPALIRQILSDLDR
ncbi:MAG TPA: hypothetical protein VKV26_15800 [Dehalococcoidia bacterium]|nr:hypothetical protein [Dehalococcoidia bacterium]